MSMASPARLVWSEHGGIADAERVHWFPYSRSTSFLSSPGRVRSIKTIWPSPQQVQRSGFTPLRSIH